MQIKGPFISRVKIKNYRNFKDIDVRLTHKQVIIGENNVGKTNFLRAIQLVLDPYLSDRDRFLTDSDFNDSLENPMEKGEEIEIVIEIQGFEHNTILKAQLASDASVNDTPPTLRFTYKFYPEYEDEEKVRRYQYKIFKGVKEDEPFNYQDRQLLNIRVIKALRDVEIDMRNFRRSPLLKLVNRYEFEKSDLDSVAKKFKEGTDGILSLDEILDLNKAINSQFEKLTVNQSDAGVFLGGVDIDPNRVLNTLQLMLGQKQRPVSEISLGLCNILYISLLLLSLKDNTVPSFLKASEYESLMQEDGDNLLSTCYTSTENGNYFLEDNLSKEVQDQIYRFMANNYSSDNSFTILAIEEPESHLHPILQRIIYKDIMKKSETSILFTSHSTHVASIAPINSIVHLKKDSLYYSDVKSTAPLTLSKSEKVDIERYIDAHRGEIYFGRGVILVEGIAEEYLVPAFAEILGLPLENSGIVVCNINSTNFKPYVKLLKELSIPYSAITDGDFYKITEEDKRLYHTIYEKGSKIGYLGNEIVIRILDSLEIIKKEKVPTDFKEQDLLFNKEGFFLGNYTLEVDIMETSNADANSITINAFEEVTLGGTTHKGNFRNALENRDFWKCLRMIEGRDIGKGRFAQKLSTICVEEHIPDYIRRAISHIVEQVKLAE
jgi:putative ATP-dependent endonuclease of OLD family